MSERAYILTVLGIVITAFVGGFVLRGCVDKVPAPVVEIREVRVPGDTVKMPGEIVRVPVKTPVPAAADDPVAVAPGRELTDSGAEARVRELEAQLWEMMYRIAEYETMTAVMDTQLVREAVVVVAETDSVVDRVPFVDGLSVSYAFPPASAFDVRLGSHRFALRVPQERVRAVALQPKVEGWWTRAWRGYANTSAVLVGLGALAVLVKFLFINQ